jgi:hypothetical protein
LLVSVTVLLAAVAFTNWLPNVRFVGESVTGATPVPANCAVCGLLASLSLTVKTPVCRPRVVGVNVIAILQLPFIASVFGARGQFVVSEKLPDTEMLLMVSGPVAPFVNVSPIGPLEVPTEVFANVKLVGLNV